MTFDRSAYLDAFREESEEHLSRLSAGILELERRAADPEAIAALFRSAHTIKGGARMMGYPEIGELANRVEDVLDGLRRGRLRPSPAMVDGLLAAVDALQRQIATVAGGGRLTASDASLLEWLERLAGDEEDPATEPGSAPAAGAGEPPEPPGAGEPPPASDPAHDPAGAAQDYDGDVDPARVQARSRTLVGSDVEPGGPGTSSPGPAGARPGSPLAGISPLPTDRQPGGAGSRRPAAAPGAAASPDASLRSVRVGVDKLDRVLNLAGELLVQQREVRQRIQESRELWGLVEAYDRSVAAGDAATVSADWASLRAAIARWQRGAVRADERATELAEELHYEVGRLRMFPLSSLFSTFPRAVRDMAREQDKEVRLLVEGELTEVDKQVLEALRDPLLHLVRNALDHGVERPAVRLARGKPRQATIVLRGYPHGSQVVIEVQDDGAGIDVETVRRVAIDRRVLSWSAAQSLSDEEIQQVIFRPGFSTRREVGPTSGRGVGLDVVKSQVQQLKGEVTVRSEVGKGTCFTLRVPLSLALLRVLLTRVGSQYFALPLSAVEGVVSVAWRDLEAVQGQPALDWGDRLLPVASLAHTLDLAVPERRAGAEPAVVVGAAGRTFALVVDAIVGEENIVAKPLPPLLGGLEGVSATAPLSETDMAIVLHPEELLVRARQVAPRAAPGGSVEPAPRRILVVDDSVTTRELERSILQAAGYIVETAVDGIDAWTRLADRRFDLLVVDVEMPGLDGFALTERVRAAPHLAATPVVIVSARSSPEDRERGLRAGAQAYIAKSAFDQTNLLDTVERLLD